MSGRTDSQSAPESRLERVLAEYLRAVDEGRPIDRAELLAAYPDLAGELRSFFANRDAIARMSEPFEGPPSEMPTVGFAEHPAEAPPRVRYFGDYEILAEIARGGMGVVYRARQVSLNRQVALKMILAGQLASPADVERFQREAEAAANLDHPNIVPIYEVGQHEGQHYFSMKLVEGGSLARRMPQLLKSPRDAAKLLLDIARAVHYAHQRGILHRDLKPANILLDATGRPMVTDFGLAKQVESQGGQTSTGAVVGTPAYMAPEQARGEKGLTTAVDIYSLGAILYALLTGHPPFQGATPMETLLMVISDEPKRPSSVLPRVERDLETIALKCLAKEPQRRYRSAEELADDLARYLAGEPIVARPVGCLERAVKWAKRRPAIAGLLAALVAVAVAGFGGVYWKYREAEQQKVIAQAQRDRAEEQKVIAEEQRELAEQHRHKAEVERRRAEAGEKLARERLVQVAAEKQIAQSVRDFLQNKLLGQADAQTQADALLRAGGLAAEARENPTIRELLDRAAKELAADRIEANFPHQPLIQAEILQTVGNTYRGVGEHQRAIGFLQHAVALYRQHLGPEHSLTLTSMNNLAEAYRAAGKLDLALPLLEETLKLRKATFGPEHPQTLISMNNLALAYLAAGKVDLALPLDQETLKLRKAKLGPEHLHTLASMNNLAAAYQAAGKLDLALPLLEETLKLMKATLGPEHPHTLMSMNNLAAAYQAAGKLDLAPPLLEETLKVRKAKLGPEHPDTLISMDNLAAAYQAAGQPNLALPLHDEALKLMKATLGPEHPHTLISMNNLALAYQAAGKLDLALPLFEETLKLRKTRLGPEHPGTLISMGNLALAYQAAGKLDLALPLFEETLKLMKAKLGPEHPHTLSVMGYLAGAYEAAGKSEQAIALWKELLVAVRRPLPKQSPQLAAQLAQVAASLLQAGAFTEAEPLLRECLAIRENTQPDDWATFCTKSMLGDALLGQKKYAAAEPLLLAGYEGMKQREAKIPPSGKVRLTQALERLVQLDEALQKKDEAAKWRKELEARKQAR